VAFTAFLDTNVLYGVYLCDTLLRLAEEGTHQPQWSAGVLEELERNLVERAGLAREAAQRRISEMQRAFPDAEVHGYEALIESMTCDPKDRHVLAAAVRCQSAVLVTFNGDDFPEDSTRPYDIGVINTDDFLLDQLDLYPGVTVAVLRHQASDYTAPPMTLEQLLGALPVAGVPKFAAEVQRHLQPSEGD
jgi:predicted nucleic acid-binding protein